MMLIKFKSYCSVFVEEPAGTITTINKMKFDHPLSTIQLTEDMIVKKLSKLNIAKSPGPDSIHP